MTQILILAANPRGTSELRLGEEVRCIQEGLRRARDRDQFVINSEWAVQTQGIRQAILQYKPQIVHFSGHGVEDGGLAFENTSGQVQLVHPEALAGLFRLLSNHVKCVLLNACYSEIQANAIVEHIDFVIGMAKPISDRAAIEFAIGFYDALGNGYPVETAYEFGCNAIHLAGFSESLTPVLKCKNNMLQDKRIDPPCTPSLMPETNTRSLTQTSTKARAKYEFVLSGSVDEVGKPKLEAIVAHLQKVTGDTSLTLLEVESGSIKLVLEGSEESFQLLESLIASGELDEVLGIPVQGINRRGLKSSQQVSTTKVHTEASHRVAKVPMRKQVGTTRTYTGASRRVTRALMQILPASQEGDPLAVQTVVFELIPANSMGYIKFQGMLWRARCSQQIALEPGMLVRVIDRENLTLIVEPISRFLAPFKLTAVTTPHLEQKQTLDEFAAEIQQLLNELSKTHSTNTTAGKMRLAAEAIAQIENSPSLMQRTIRVIQASGTHALEQLLNHPAASFVIDAMADWQETKKE